MAAPPTSTPPPRKSSQPTQPVRRWIRDEEADNCMVCQKSFGLLTRKHHCRSCGRVVCDTCSQRRWPKPSTTGGTPEKVRVCNECYDKLMTRQNDLLLTSPPPSAASAASSPATATTAATTAAATSPAIKSVSPAGTAKGGVMTAIPLSSPLSSAATAGLTSDRLIYNTQTLCARCAFIDKKGFHLKAAQLWHRIKPINAIVLSGHCEVHGPLNTIVCKNPDFYYRMQSFTDDHSKYLTLKREHRHSTAVARRHTTHVASSAALKASADQPPAASAAAIIGQKDAKTVDSAAATSVAGGASKPLLADIEDLDTHLKLSPQSKTLPMVVDVTVYRNDAFISDAEIEKQLHTFHTMYPKSYHFVIKLRCGLVEKNEIQTLNDKLLRIVSLPVMKQRKDNPLLIDLAVERLVDLTSLPNTCMLKGRIYPAVCYYVSVGEEMMCVNELTGLLDKLKAITDIQCVLLLSVDKPYPDLTAVFQFIFQNKGMIRFVMFSRERSPNELLQRLSKPLPSLPTASTATAAAGTTPPAVTASAESYSESIDPYELLEVIEKGSGGRIRAATDYAPVRIGALFEPLFRLLGQGSFAIRPSPFCGFGTVLVSTHTPLSYKTGTAAAAAALAAAKAAVAAASAAAGGGEGKEIGLQSIPITRLFDCRKLYHVLLPLALKLEKDMLGISTVKQIQQALQDCSLSGVPIPDLLSFIGPTADDLNKRTLKSFIRHLQFVVVHNTMDFDALDMVRRCECAIVAPSTAAKFGLAAACTGCI